jgi:adenylate cyclase
LSLHWIRYGLGLLMLALMLGHSLRLYDIPLVSRLEAIVYDSKVRLTMPQTMDERVVIVDIDEKSLSEQGRWPWGRDKIATLVNKLFEQHGTAVLGFDVVFAEADESSGLMSLERLSHGALRDNGSFQGILQNLRPQLDNDARFAEAIKGRQVVLGYPFSNAANIRTGSLPKPALLPGDFTSEPAVYSYASFNGNLERFQAVAAAGGHFNPITDIDGITRRVPMVLKYDNRYYEALSLAMVRARLGFPSLAPGYPPGAGVVEWLELRGDDKRARMQVPVDENLCALIPYRGYARSFQYVSAADILKDRVAPGIFKDKLVLVGTTAPGLLDLRATPVDGAYPGVEVHANLIAGMLDGALKHKPAYVLAIDVLVLIAVGAIMIFVLPLLSPAAATAMAMLMAAGVVGFNLVLWTSANLLVPLANSLILLCWIFALNMSWGYFIESRSKRQFTELFGQYVPPELVDEMAKNPQNYSMEGRKAELTVLFSDIRGFTTISEGLQPDQLATLMNEYLGAMTDVVRHHRGTLDKYIGDAIMAFWGAPVDDPEHARNAVLTALEMQQALVELNKTLVARGWPHLAIGVGVNTGVMTVGDMGSSVRKSYTVMGDAVNTGSRLEGITKQYGVGIIVGEATREALRDSEFVFRELDRVRVKGKDGAVGIYEPMAAGAALSKDQREELALWNQTLKQYRAQDWDQAELGLLNLQRMAPKYLYELYAERLAYYRKNPPGEGWDGVTAFETK